MKASARVVLTALAAIATYYFVFWVPFSLLGGPGVIAQLVSLGCGVMVGRYVWRQTAGGSPGLGTAMLTGGLMVGAVGFVGGFFGPMILAPGANQGPLLGLLITGPLGVVAGSIGGAIWWGMRRRRGTRGVPQA